MTTPTIEQVIKAYRVFAAAQLMKTGRPGEETVANTVRGALSVCAAAGIPITSTVDALTRKAIDNALVTFVQRGLERITAWTYVCQVRALFSRWCRPYYREAGWRIPRIELPSFRATTPHYERPSLEMLERVKNWYRCQTHEHWFAATMMLEFAMRNGDVLRLKSENFVTVSSSSPTSPTPRHFLSYTPHKTAMSSGRRVYWPIHDVIWQTYSDYGGLESLDVTDETFSDINRDLRALGFTGHKGAYELRKICIDHVYQKFGAEAASSISGDTIRTITRFYADPAQPNIGAMRIIDLL